MNTLILDSASKYLYIAIVNNDEIIYSSFIEGKNNHSDNLLPTLEEALKNLNMKLKDINKIVVGIGPGSYTGLRVGVTVGKMLAWTLGVPLFKASSLDILSSGCINEDGIYAITMHAKKDHIYAKLVEIQKGITKQIIKDGFFKTNEFLEMIKEYSYKLINEASYNVDPFRIITEEVIYLHKLVPNYIQKEI